MVTYCLPSGPVKVMGWPTIPEPVFASHKTFPVRASTAQDSGKAQMQRRAPSPLISRGVRLDALDQKTC